MKKCPFAKGRFNFGRNGYWANVWPCLDFFKIYFPINTKNVSILVILLSYHCCIHIVCYIDVMYSETACADPESFARGGPIFFIRGKRIQIALKADHHRPASEMPFKWRFACGPMMAQH